MRLELPAYADDFNFWETQVDTRGTKYQGWRYRTPSSDGNCFRGYSIRIPASVITDVSKPSIESRDGTSFYRACCSRHVERVSRENLANFQHERSCVLVSVIEDYGSHETRFKLISKVDLPTCEITEKLLRNDQDFLEVN